MNNNLKRAIQKLRYRGHKVSTRNGRIVSLDGLKVSKKTGTKSIELERKALGMAKLSAGRISIVDGKSKVVGSQISEYERNIRRIRKGARRYNRRMKQLGETRLTLSDETISKRLERGETYDDIVRSMTQNLMHKYDIAYSEGVHHLISTIPQSKMPQLYAELTSKPDYALTDTALAEINYILYDKNKSWEQRDEDATKIAREGHKLALERLASFKGLD